MPFASFAGTCKACPHIQFAAMLFNELSENMPMDAVVLY